MPERVALLDPVNEIIPALDMLAERLPTFAVSKRIELPLLIIILLYKPVFVESGAYPRLQLEPTDHVPPLIPI